MKTSKKTVASIFIFILNIVILQYTYSLTFTDGCLFAFTQGPDNTEITDCADNDPLDLAHNKEIKTALAILGVNSNQVRFKGCTHLPFSTRLDPLAENKNSFLVTYPTGRDESLIAPITHELVHIRQVQLEGGFSTLRNSFDSKRIELCADYVAGIVFSNAFQHLSRNEFQHNLSLTGQYYENDSEAHGTPAQRIASFRFGLYSHANLKEQQLSYLFDEFYSEIYGNIQNMTY